MKPAFKIFKAGTTTKGPVQIVYAENDLKPYDIKAKVKFYRSLGYEVTDIQTK